MSQDGFVQVIIGGVPLLRGQVQLLESALTVLESQLRSDVGSVEMDETRRQSLLERLTEVRLLLMQGKK